MDADRCFIQRNNVTYHTDTECPYHTDSKSVQRAVTGLKPSFSANPSHCSPSFLLLKYSLHGFPGLFTVISEHISSLLLVFLFLHFLVVGSVQ